MALSSTTFASLFNFSRSGTATYLDSNGVLQTAADGVARTAAYRYVGGVLTGPSLRLESEAATNLFLYSNDFSNAAWSKSNVTVTDQGDGSFALEDTADAGYLTQAVDFVSGSFGVLTIDAKAGTANWLAVRTIGFTADDYEYFDLSNGVTGGGTQTKLMESMGGGWYRCSVVIDISSDTAGTPRFYVAETDEGGGNTGAGKNILIRRAQAEVGSIPTSYIPTSGATATRSAETLAIAAADMPTYTDAVCVQMGGTMNYADNGVAAGTSSAGEVCFWVWLADTSNYVSAVLSTASTATGTPVFIQEESGTRDAVVGSDAYAPGVNVAFNISARYTSEAINGAVDGTALTEDTTPTAIADLSTADFDVGFTFNGHIDELLVWNEDIGDAGIAEASA